MSLTYLLNDGNSEKRVDVNVAGWEHPLNLKVKLSETKSIMLVKPTSNGMLPIKSVAALIYLPRRTPPPLLLFPTWTNLRRSGGEFVFSAVHPENTHVRFPLPDENNKSEEDCGFEIIPSFALKNIPVPANSIWGRGASLLGSFKLRSAAGSPESSAASAIAVVQIPPPLSESDKTLVGPIAMATHVPIYRVPLEVVQLSMWRDDTPVEWLDVNSF